MRTEINKHIIADSNICHGQLTFKGTRVMVWQVIELLGAGVTIEEILTRYFPQITREAIFSALEYASGIIEEEKYVAFQE
jgi:uncharacterized protein (DUF433 family)